MMNTELPDESPETGASEKPRKIARRALRPAGVITLVLVLGAGLLIGSFIRFANEVINLVPPAEIAGADGIVVLTGGSQRIDQAIELLNGGAGDRLLISGVNPDISSRQIARVTSAEPAMFECCIDIGHDAIDTVGNANEAAQWVAENKFVNVVVVTSNYHMPRSLMELRRVDSTTNFIPYPVIANDFSKIQWLQHSGSLRLLVAEYVKYMAARAHLIRGGASRDGLRSSLASADNVRLKSANMAGGD